MTKRSSRIVAPLCVASWLAAPAVLSQTLPQVTVTATPLGDTALDASQPAVVLRTESLDRQRGVSLGATVDALPGVSQTGFGLAAGRPVIRGLGGPRVGVTSNGLDLLDASSLSPDHAVAVDPLQATQIEVLRGPATLLYGGGAIGGLVNVVDERIPTTRLSGISGQAIVAGDTASDERLGSAQLRGGHQGLNWTVGAFRRHSDDYRIPGYATVGDADSARGRLPNSFTDASGASAGVSYVGRWGAAGLSYSRIDNRYGIPSEEDVDIDLRDRRLESLVELDRPIDGLESLRIRYARGRYGHDEIERPDGDIGTAFRVEGRDLRVEALHQPIAGWRGAVGTQWRARDLDASGDEAYVPSTDERHRGVFWVGERAFGAHRLELGVRHERVGLEPAAAASAARRSFGLNSASVGGSTPLSPTLSLALNVAHAQRAPAVEELYAAGAHAATSTFEIGNPALSKERANNFELALRGRGDALTWQAGVFHQRFANYVYGSLTDEDGDGVADRVDDAGDIANSVAAPRAGELDRLEYRQARARFYGLEAEFAWRPRASAFGWRVFGDTARGSLKGAGDVPRMTPTRIGASVDYRQGAWNGFVSVLRALEQDRVAALETPVSGYTRVDAEIAYTWRWGPQGQLTAFVQGRNLTDDEIRLSTSFVRDRVPMPGRSVYAGLRGRF